MVKKYKDEVVVFWSGAKMRYRKDGKPDMRYMLGRKETAMVERAKPIKKSPKKVVTKQPEMSLFNMVRVGLRLGAIVATVMVLQAILDGTSRNELISPLSDKAVVKEEITAITKKTDVVLELFYKYDWPAETMIAIAKSENGYEYNNEWMPKAEFTGNSNGETDRGILMINSGTFADFKRRHGVEGVFEDMFEADKNIAMGFLIYQEQGLDAWTDHRNDRYLKFLEDANE